MLSYRHAFHAGNHADVLKHLTLTLTTGYLLKKDKPLWYIDTHAGAGGYSLIGDRATKTAEAQTGVGRLWGREDLAPEIQSYLRVLANWNGKELKHYPGSPRFMQALLREQDALRLFELHSTDHEILQEKLGSDARVKISNSDGLAGLKSLLPPPTRRALTLIDPSYESKEDYLQVAAAVKDSLQRFSTGVYLIWYPLLNRSESRQMTRQLQTLHAKWLQVELTVKKPSGNYGMTGSGMYVINPPWLLKQQLELVMPQLVKELGQDGSAGMKLDVGEL